MNTKTSQKETETLTSREMMHYTLLWCYNWTKEHFKEAFKDSPVGWKYFWDKFQNENERVNNATSAIAYTILGMDNKHQQMLADFIIQKNIKQVKSARQWEAAIENMENQNQEDYATS